MKETINVSWADKMAFEASVEGYKIMIDASPESGGQNKGPRPKPFVLIALAGCTAMDVVSILTKMRVDLKGFDVAVDGDLTEEHPKQFTNMHIVYKFKGTDLPMDKLQKAIDLSLERYCGVHATLSKSVKITHEIKIEA